MVTYLSIHIVISKFIFNWFKVVRFQMTDVVLRDRDTNNNPSELLFI